MTCGGRRKGKGRETRPSGPGPARPGRRRALPGNRPPTSSNFLALPVTNTTLRRTGAAILAPRGACAPRSQSPLPTAPRPATPSQWGRLPPMPERETEELPVPRGRALAGRGAAPGSLSGAAGRHGSPGGRAHPAGPRPSPQAAPALPLHRPTAAGPYWLRPGPQRAGAVASLFTSPAPGSRGRRIPVPVFPEVEPRVVGESGQRAVLLPRLCTF